ncbi:uncharacterized protein TRAVEDRAFT_44975 [Trametes versicolor FP-101664 SS1]|uniref:uncharacterized protein n=1 Tax=Trametes versicolor (strain FP-101664) TaxID=717944 RepID=UPI0004624820|nr:uncharacterized protein TRAVEDRAFT_44975 [Trametes versicolor FP-101664 SS1]EIW62142.1 hypothetical protein TRAVEDRAFT_44975 [Trametes versicolor FP-101664 SS1]
MQTWGSSWGDYSGVLQCTNKPTNGFLDYTEPNDIPNNIVIPSWAYQPLKSDGTVDLPQASEVFEPPYSANAESILTSTLRVCAAYRITLAYHDFYTANGNRYAPFGH